MLSCKLQRQNVAHFRSIFLHKDILTSNGFHVNVKRQFIRILKIFFDICFSVKKKALTLYLYQEYLSTIYFGRIKTPNKHF